MQVLIFLSLMISALVDAKLFGGKTGVPELSARNFRDQVLYNGNVTGVVFYAPWCGYCQQLSSEWKKTAKALNGVARVVAVNCDEDLNKPLCSKYKVQGFPTIKVFQPAKLTDVDLKNTVVDGKPLPKRRPKVYDYKGARESKAITEFIVSHLRNYVATLDSDKSLKWLAPNKIPRVIMLPGKKYKSRLVSPLLKTLSREYFGKLRFAAIPRRVDGAWNLLGMKAPDESQLVYLSDDKAPVVYKGSMKKKAIKQFLEEQYELEMNRRKHVGGDVNPQRDAAANGMEFVVEDQQTEELEHVKREQELRREHEKAAEEARIAAFSRYGVEMPSKEQQQTGATSTRENDNENENQKLSTTTTTTAAAAAAAAKPTAAIHADTGTTASTSTVDDEGEEAEDFDFDASANTSNADEEDEQAFNDPEDFEEVALDSTVTEVSPDQIVQEGPEAIASYLAQQRESHGDTGSNTVEHTAKGPRPTPKAVEPGMHNYDMFVERCFRPGHNCAVLVTTPQTKDDDLIILLRALEKTSSKIKKHMYVDYMYADENPEIQEFLEAVGVTQRPGFFWWDTSRQKLAIHESGWTSSEIKNFLTSVGKRAISVSQEVPHKFLYWLTKSEVEALAQKEAEKPSAKDEL